jgi:hypothetical protein
MPALARTVASLALVKFSWDHLKQDHLDAFVPFVATLLKAGKYDAVFDEDVHRLCREFAATFGFEIPYHPMVALLNRAKKRGLLMRLQGRFVPAAAKIGDYDLTERALRKEAQLDDLVNRFIGFAQDGYSRSVTKDEAHDGLIGFLKSHDLDILFASENGSVLPDVKPSKAVTYLVARFIQHLYQTDKAGFSFVVDVAVGHALASALLFREIDRFTARLKDVHVYCDTRFLLRLVGVEGGERQLAYHALVQALRANGARLHMFRHTYDEMMGILQGCRRWVKENASYDPSKASPAVIYFVEHGYGETDVDDFIIRADQNLRDEAIGIAEGPAPSELVDYQIDETKLREAIVRVYEKSGHFDEIVKATTLDRDIKSIAAVSKLRKGRTPVLIKQAGHIFTTTNYSLAYGSRRFELASGLQVESIPVCITDVFLGTVLWLQSPAIVAALHETRLVAQCAATLQLDHEMLKKLVKIAAKLKTDHKVTDDEYYLLRASPVVHEMLGEKTLGDPEAFSASTVDEVLSEIQQKAKSKEFERYKVERDEHQQTQLKLTASQLEKAQLAGRSVEISDTIGRLVAAGLFALLLAAGAAIVVVPFFTSLVERPIVKVLCVIGGVIMGLAGFGYELNFRDMRDRVRTSVKTAVLAWLTETHTKRNSAD